jgi:hypothetical protein
MIKNDIKKWNELDPDLDDDKLAAVSNQPRKPSKPEKKQKEFQPRQLEYAT